MINQQARTYTIRFSFHNNRLNISKDVLRCIGSPEFIQVFVNRDRKSLYIKGCEGKVTNSFSVPIRVYADPEYKYVLRKAAFSEAICSATGWHKQGRYRLYGAPVSRQVIVFSFTDAERLDDEEQI